MEVRELYRTLGLRPGVSDEAIKSAYRGLAKKYHPDLNGTPNAGAVFEKITQAYQELLEHRRRTQLIFSTVHASFSKQESLDIFVTGEMLVSARSPATRSLAAHNLGQSGKKASYVYLKRALRDTDSRVVRAAVRAVAQLCILQSAPDLAALYAVADTAVRMEILTAVKRINRCEKFSSVLRLARGDRSAEVRDLYSRLFEAERWRPVHA